MSMIKVRVIWSRTLERALGVVHPYTDKDCFFPKDQICPIVMIFQNGQEDDYTIYVIGDPAVTKNWDVYQGPLTPKLREALSDCSHPIQHVDDQGNIQPIN